MSQLKAENRVMLFDLSIYGHHPTYIGYLINYWQQHQIPGILDIVVIPKFLEVHQDVVNLVKPNYQNAINFVPISELEAAKLKLSKSSWQRNIQYFQEWAIACKYAKSLAANHCLLMYFDTYQLPILFSTLPSCQISGIYFKPTFHYQYLGQIDLTWQGKLQNLREKIVLKYLLQKPYLSALFSLDNYVIKYLQDFPSAHKVVPLADPIAFNPAPQLEVEKMRENLQIDAEKQIFLVFGALSPRKGIDRILEAISLLDNELSDRYCLLLVGEASIENQSQFISAITLLQQQKPVQIVCKFEFVPDEEIPIYFQLADLVLAPYQRHVGMSGILLLAAAAGKPVLSADYGLMGQVVREYQLGMTVDASNPQAIAQALTKFLLHSGEVAIDSSRMQALATANCSERFAETIFHHILSFAS